MDTAAITQLNLVVKMTLTACDAQNRQFKNLFNYLIDEQLQKEIASDKWIFKK